MTLQPPRLSSRSLLIQDYTPSQSSLGPEPNSRTRLLSAQPSSSSSDGSSPFIHPGQTSMPSLHRWSQLTPFRLESKEGGGGGGGGGRKSVLSSLGKKYTTLRKGHRTEKRVISEQLTATTTTTQNRTSSAGRFKFATTKRSTKLPLPKSGSMFSLHRDSPGNTQQRTGTVTAVLRSDTDADEEITALPVQNDRKRPTLRKVRMKLQSLPRDESLHLHLHLHLQSPREISNTFSKIKDEMRPRKIWSQGLPGLRSREKSSPGTKPSGGGLVGDIGVQAKDSPGAEQREDRTERMVSESRPKHYWLGRFVTLTNAFHYVDSFNEPDTATGFGMVSGYFRPTGTQGETEMANHRVKRAFRVLENVCVTEEASTSLRRFREEYVSRFGGRFGGRSVG